MNKYYSLSPSNKSQIHSLLSPIFEVVRKNKIHSYHQLQNNHENEEVSLDKETNKINYIFEKKPKTANNKIVSDIFDKPIKAAHQTMYARVGHKFISQDTIKQIKQQKLDEEKIEKQPHKLQFKGKSTGNSPSKTFYNKMFRVNSKIKKHLVEYIDFEQIQKMFYKKRNMMTRYQYFLKIKNQTKQKSEQNRKIGYHRRARSKQIYIDSSDFKDQKTEPYKQLSSPIQPFQTNYNSIGLKSPTKKKFWGRENHHKKLIIQENTQNIIEGKTYKTIEV